MNTDWGSLNKIELGQAAKEYVRNQFLACDFNVLELRQKDAEVDFTVKFANCPEIDVKVKSVYRSKYIFYPKPIFKLRASLYFVVVLFNSNELTRLYLIPSMAWLHPDDLLVSHDYIGKASEPEWGVNISEKNMELLESFRFDKMIQKLKSPE